MTRTVGTGKAYDYNDDAMTASASGDEVDTYKTEIDGDPNVYWETVTVPAANTITWTFVDRGVWIKNKTADATTIYAAPNVSKTHILTGVRAYTDSYPNNTFYSYNHAGNLVVSRCEFHNRGGGTAAFIRPSATGVSTITFNIAIGTGGSRGIMLQSGGAGASIAAYNNTCFNNSDVAGVNPFTINDTNSAIDAQNNFAHNFHANTSGDYYSYNGTLGAQAASNRSTDGTLSTTDIGGLTDAGMVDPYNYDVHIKTGSGLDGVGTDVGVITDIDGNSVDTGVNPFVGCSSIASAPSAPTNATYYANATTNDYLVTCDAPASELLKLRCKVTISGTDYYVIIRPNQNGFEYELTDDTTVIYAKVNQGKISFNTSTAPSYIGVVWANANDVLSDYTEASASSGDYPSSDNVRLNTVFNFGSASGNMVVPTASQLIVGATAGASGTEVIGNVVLPSIDETVLNTKYGASGTQYTGIFHFPTESQTLDSVGFGASGTQYTGNIILPSPSDVEVNVPYGASGTQYLGVFYYPDEDLTIDNTGYGANQTEFTGNFTFPTEVQTKSGVNYGASGIQYQGIFTGASGTPPSQPVVSDLGVGPSKPVLT